MTIKDAKWNGKQKEVNEIRRTKSSTIFLKKNDINIKETISFRYKDAHSGWKYLNLDSVYHSS